MPIDNIPSNKSNLLEEKLDDTDVKPLPSGKFSGRSVKSTLAKTPEVSKLMDIVEHVKSRIAVHKNILQRSSSKATPVKIAEFDKRLERISSEPNKDSERALEQIIQEVDDYDQDYVRKTIKLLQGRCDEKIKLKAPLVNTTQQTYEKELKQMEQGLKEIQENWKEYGKDNFQDFIEKLTTLQIAMEANDAVEGQQTINEAANNPESILIQNKEIQKQENDNSAQAFLNKLSQWESKGSGEEQRGEAAARIKQAFTEKTSSLNISNLKLSEFPEAIFDIPSLEELSLGDNAFDHLPEGFDRLPNLEYLYCLFTPLKKIPESLIAHPMKKLKFLGLDRELLGQWSGLRENYLKRDNILVQTYRNRHDNEDGTVSFEQGPISLSPKAMKEHKFWVYNEEPQTVYRGIGRTPHEILKEGGLYTKSMSTEGIKFHVHASAYASSKLNGGAISTSTSLKVASSFAQNYEAGYVYKIELMPHQGVDVCKTCQALIDSGTIDDDDELEGLRIANMIGSGELEVSVIGSISSNQISVMDEATKTFIPINEWVDPKTDV